mgnify:FL=1
MADICVIGGSGFIGTRLCRRFDEAGRDFLLVDKRQSQTFPDKTIIADVRDIDALRKVVKGVAIINLAAEHRDDVTPRSLYDEVNVEGAKNVCRVAQEKWINKIIFTSSVAVYGFAEPNTDEKGKFAPFNDYGRTKMLAEQVYRSWYERDPDNRCLVIVRPTVVFGEQNRGNVYNLLNQIAKGRFLMVGNGQNKKSMAYVENVAAFLEHCLSFGPGLHIYNYVDKPDFAMNELVQTVRKILNNHRHALYSTSQVFHFVSGINLRIPYPLGYLAGKLFDLASYLTSKKYPISSIRIKKFCSTTQFETSVSKTGFVPPVSLLEGLENTIKYEFIDKRKGQVFYTE